MISELGRRQEIIDGSNNDGSFGDDLEKEIGMLLREQRRPEVAVDHENMYRSGSAPPTIDGSLSAVGGLFSNDGVFSDFVQGENDNVVLSEEELRSDPAYSSYYYLNAKLNPRLPPPLLSKEDWRFAQRLQGGSLVLGGVDDKRKVSKFENGPGRSLFSMPPGFSSKKENRVEVQKVRGSADWVKDGLPGLPGIGLGSKQKSLAEIFQDGLEHSNPHSRHPSRPGSRNAFDDNVDVLSSAEAELIHLREGDNLQSSCSASYSFATALGAPLSRSTTPDPQHIARVPSPCPTPIGEGRAGASKKSINNSNSFNGLSSVMSDSSDLAAALSGMNLSTNGNADGENNLRSHIESNYIFNVHSGSKHGKQQQPYMKKVESGHLHLPSVPQSATRGGMGGPQIERKSGGNPGVLYSKGSPMSSPNGGGLSPHYSHLDGTGSSFGIYGPTGFSLNPGMASMMANQQLGNFNLPMGVPGLDSRVLAGQNLNADSMYHQYMLSPDYGAHVSSRGDESSEKYYMELLQKAYMGSVMPPLKSPYGAPLGNKSTGSNHGYYENHGFGIGMGYPGSPLTSPVVPNSPGGPNSPLRANEFNMHFPGSVRSLGGVMGSWKMDATCGSSLLEEFKSNKTKCFELSEIASHVVEFSADQYGSRFIQQKLETATIEEKNMVFEEINPHALSLMTDVFGNYVIQKFFEHGMDSQRRELANKLDGHVLTLGLQMYGCRVIQKAIEVVDLDQKIRMVHELDGHTMRCVRDQNGNHVIQKCIECVPEDDIQFIVESFFDQVVTLSTHPYGCRVIQRVLEHCKDPHTQNKVMDEILGSVSMLAQDQYGNYVVQHVLEHGKPHERTAIIKELAGKIVQMSQQKFASNVVEKCLAFGNIEERELLVNEMLGTTDENEPLQAMMKDQFANYVVQKMLETCSDQQREHTLARIKVHLNALKKYTYGKHIVARVEKLVAAGERRIAVQSTQPHPA